MEDELFTRPYEVPIVICKKCQYAVRPTEIIRHLQSTHHQLPLATARQISEAIYRWDGVEACDHWIVPISVAESIPGLPMYTDGILCNRVSGCGFVARSIKTIRNHWHAKHGWISQNVRRNRKQAHTQAQREIIQATIIVSCQRAFTHGAGSHYIHVQRASLDHTVDLEAENTPQPQVINQLVAQLEDAFTEQQAQRTVIEAGERDEANPWLRRTQWAVYLAGLDPARLVECVQRPSEADTDNDRAALAIWDSMQAVARISQKVSSRAGHTIRIEAVRTERDQTPHTPLQAYIDEDNIVRHTIPWQQVLMFFARTQTQHNWESPHYRFTERQRKAWQALWRLARAEGSRSNSVSCNPPLVGDKGSLLNHYSQPASHPASHPASQH